MNILPKKRWHVRNRENIARVRKDEADAAEAEKEKERRKRLAEQEARIGLMRQQTRRKYGLPLESEPVIEYPPKEETLPKHINFFEDIEEGAIVTNVKNAAHEKEIKDEKEKYEKQIGYLTYLGQDTNEASGNVSWYNVPPSSITTSDDDENDLRKKSKLDPICIYKHHFGKHNFAPKKAVEESKTDVTMMNKKSKVHKKRKKHKSKHKRASSARSSSASSTSSSDSSRQLAKEDQLRVLREQRLKREKQEKLRAEKLLAKMRGEIVEEKADPHTFEQKYNSQFNPHLARQNVK